MKSIERASWNWLHSTSRLALQMVLDAGNPATYTTQIDGATRGGRVVEPFRAGSIENAKRSVRFYFIGRQLADLAERARPILLSVIKTTFPKSRHLRYRWHWWIAFGGLRNSNTPARYIGDSLPTRIDIEDVLFLVPTTDVAPYAWIANRNAKRGLAGNAFKYNMKRTRGKNSKALVGTLKRRQLGYLAEATRRLRGTRSQERTAGISVQGWFVRRSLTGPYALMASGKRRGEPWEFGVPVIRLAFVRGLRRPVKAS